MKSPCTLLAAVAAWLALGSGASAQTVASPPMDPARSKQIGDVVELPPFQVQAGDSTGWTPSQTLAGTRFRTNLADLATQMDVFTMDFMGEFGFTSIEQAAVYSLNVENNDEFVRDIASKGGGGGDLRVRGIGQARRTREFFGVSTAADNYNLERVTVASGPNPMMFGIGAPTGAVDASLARPIMNKQFGTLKLQTDSWGGTRGELQFNRTLSKDKLAFRGALLADNKKFDPRPSIERDRRLYGALLYTPFKKTRISAHFEKVNIHSRRPARTVVYDDARVWYYAGDLGASVGNKFLFPNSPAWLAAGRNTIDNRVFSLGGDGITVTGGNNPGGVPVMGNYGSVGVQGIDDQGRWPNVVDSVNAGNNGVALIDDRIYPRDASYHYFTDYGTSKASIVNLFFNQEIVRDLHFEAGYQTESRAGFGGSMMLAGNGGIELKVDPNQLLPDGRPNPYAGTLFFSGDTGFNHRDDDDSEWRATVSYRFDFKERFKNRFLRWFGEHRVAGVVSGIKQEGMNQEYRYRLQPIVENGRFRDPVFTGINYGAPDAFGRLALSPLGAGFSGQANNRVVNYRAYVSDSLGLIPRADGYEIGQPWKITDARGETWTVDPMRAATGTNGEQLITGRNTGGNKTEFGSKLFSYQGYFFGDRIVATYGRRTDTANTVREMAPDVFWRHPETGVVMPAGTAGYQAHRRYWTFPDFNSANEQSGTTQLRGIVVHPFRNWRWKLPLGAEVSLLYTESDTYAPNTTSRSPDGRLHPGEKGSGTDKGFRLGLFGGDFNVRYNEYEVESGPSQLDARFRGFRGAMRPVIKDIFGALVKNQTEFREKFPVWPLQDRSGGAPQFAYPFASGSGFAAMNFFNYLDPYGVTADTAASGKEITLQWKPTRNIDVRFTWNAQKVTQTNIAKDWIAFAKQFEAIMDKTFFTEGYVPGDSETIYQNPAGFDMNGNGVIERFTWADIPVGNGAGQVNPTTVGAANTPWGRHDGAVAGGWTALTMKENWIANVWNGNAGIPVLEAYEGRVNDFTRDNRWNLNTMYRFSEGRLRGLRVGAGYRWRAPAAIGFGVQTVNGQKVPDTDIIQKGKAETAFDFSFGYSGKSKWLGDRKYNLGLNIRNAFPSDDYVPRNRDFFTGASLVTIRTIPRQFILTCEIDL